MQHTETPRWFLDEIAHAGGEHLDADYVPGYDRKAGTDPTDDLTVLRGLGLNESHTLVDLGAVTGTLALAAAPLCRRVVAVDVSPVMLTLLMGKAERLGITNIECLQSVFLTNEHRGDPADFVYSRNALHHLPDFWKAFALERIAAILRPGGVLRLRDFVFSCEPGEVGGGRGRRGRPTRDRLDTPRARNAYPRGVQHLQLASRSDARAGRLHDPGCEPQRFEDLLGVHLYQGSVMPVTRHICSH